MTGMHTIIAGWRAAHRWMVMRTIPAGYRVAHGRMVIHTIPIPVGYQAVRRLEITATEKITKAAEVTKVVEVAGDIIISVMILVIRAAIIEGQVL